MELDELIVDPEFKSLIPPLSIEEFNQLERNIVEDGIVREPIVVWKGENIIVDGHNRYKILMDYPEIPFTVYEKEFASRYEVICWMCANQLGRRNLSELQRTILLGTAYEARKMTFEGKMQQRGEHGYFAHGTEQNAPHRETQDIVAEEYNVNPSDVKRSARFVRGLNEIENARPGTRDRILNNELEVTKKDVMALTSMNEDDKAEAIEAIVSGKRIPIQKQPEANVEYDIDDFRSELFRKVDSLDRSLELTVILTHNKFMQTDEGKLALNEALLSMTEVIKKYLKMC